VITVQASIAAAAPAGAAVEPAGTPACVGWAAWPWVADVEVAEALPHAVTMTLNINSAAADRIWNFIWYFSWNWSRVGISDR
jgi:hypothetical protein